MSRVELEVTFWSVLSYLDEDDVKPMAVLGLFYVDLPCEFIFFS